MFRFVKVAFLTGSVAAATVAAQTAAPPAAAADPQVPPVILNAISVVGLLKAGDTRTDVERNFFLDGGLQSPKFSTYLYKGCHCIKIEVDFSIKPDSTLDHFSPADTVIRVSKPYLECQVFD